MSISTPLAFQGAPISIFALNTSAAQNIAVNASGGAAKRTSAFNAKTQVVMISFATGNINIDIGANPTASASTTLLPGPFAGMFQVPLNGIISIVSADSGTPTVCVTEVFNSTNGVNGF